jgi:Xaa-Pro aminopeptidase
VPSKGSVMNREFTADFFRQNRERLRTLFSGTAPIVLTGNGLTQRNGDCEYKFRQDSSFWYLTGLDDPNIVLVMDKSKEYLIVPDRDEVIEAFDGKLDHERLAAVSGVDTVMDEKAGWKQLVSRVKKVQHVATLAPPPAYVARIGMYTNPARAYLADRLKEMNDQIELLDLRPHLSRMRAVKQDIELEAMQFAIDLTIETIESVVPKLGEYENERLIEADLVHGFRTRGAEDLSFFPIVAGGKNTTMLHYFANNASLADARMLYMDVGVEYNHYASDLTRTYFLHPPSKRETQIYQSVLDAKAYAESLLKPGVILTEYETKVQDYMGEKLRELGLIKSITKETVRKYFPSMTSHGLGLDAHDAMDYERPLEPGVVLAVEPGIYIPEEGIGVRIEDNVLITEDGIKNLSKKLPSLLQ